MPKLETEMKAVKKLLVFTNLSFVMALVLCGVAFFLFDVKPGTLPFTTFALTGTLVFLCLVIFNLICLYYYDLLVAFFSKDLKGLCDILEIWIFEKYRFSELTISYYLLLCMRLGVPWKLHELELLILSKRIALFPKLAHFFSLYYLASPSADDAQTWYLATLKYKNLYKRNEICVDYLFKLITQDQKDAAFSLIFSLLKNPLNPLDRLIIMYFFFILLEKYPADPHIEEASMTDFKKHETWLLKHRSRLPKMLDNPNSYQVDIHKILLADITKQALGWLKQWKHR